jgi:hypothetical protein
MNGARRMRTATGLIAECVRVPNEFRFNRKFELRATNLARLPGHLRLGPRRLRAPGHGDHAGARQLLDPVRAHDLDEALELFLIAGHLDHDGDG